MTRVPDESRLKSHEWGKLPALVVTSGAIKALTKAAARVYMVLVLFGWRSDGRSIVGQAELAEQTKLTPRGVRAALGLLIRHRLVTRLHRGGGHEGDAAEYQVEVGQNRKLASASEPADSCTRTGKFASERRQKHGLEPARRCLPVREQKNRAAEGAAAAGAPQETAGGARPTDPAIMEALTAAGIGGRKRTELAVFWAGLDGAAETIQKTAENMRGRGKRTGAIIAELEALAEKARLQEGERKSQPAYLTEEQRAAARELRRKYGM